MNLWLLWDPASVIGKSKCQNQDLISSQLGGDKMSTCCEIYPTCSSLSLSLRRFDCVAVYYLNTFVTLLLKKNQYIQQSFCFCEILFSEISIKKYNVLWINRNDNCSKKKKYGLVVKTGRRYNHMTYRCNTHPTFAGK